MSDIYAPITDLLNSIAIILLGLAFLRHRGGHK